MNSIKTVGDLRKALSVYPENLPFNFVVNGVKIGPGLNNDTAIYQANYKSINIELTDDGSLKC